MYTRVQKLHIGKGKAQCKVNNNGGKNTLYKIKQKYPKNTRNNYKNSLAHKQI